MPIAERCRRLGGAGIAGVALLAFVSGCETSPATGERIFTGLLPASQEAAIGEREHPRILEQFGGTINDPELERYIASLGQLVAATSERRDLTYRFSVLDSDTVNAFTTPGGFIYITRGLLALANNEAEVAGVLAHEVGHNVARHSAQRYSQTALAGIAAATLGALTGSREAAQLAQFGGMAMMQSYSREQEFEADMLGVRYLARAGYDPNAMSTFLTSINAHSGLEARLAGRGEGDSFNMMSTHPRTQDRVQRAIAEAGAARVAQPMLESDLYLRKIDGTIYGDSPEQGYVRGRSFLHTVLGFRFEVPEGFSLQNGARQVVATGPGGAGILFDGDRRPAGQDVQQYLVRQWAEGAPLREVERITVNGMPAATGAVRGGQPGQEMDLRLVAIAFDQTQVYRFVFLSPAAATRQFQEPFRRTTYSFARLSEAEKAGIRPRRIRVVEVGPGDTVESLARRMAVDSLPVEHFRVLNGLFEGRGVRPGQLVKLVTE